MPNTGSFRSTQNLIGLILLFLMFGPSSTAMAGCPTGDTCVVVKTGEAIKLAPMLSKTGSTIGVGKDNARGLWTAFQSRHQVAGREIMFVGYPGGGDDISLENNIVLPNWDDSAGAVARANLLLSNDANNNSANDIVAVLGTSTSGSATAVIPLFRAANYLMVSPANQGTQLTILANSDPAHPTTYARTTANGTLQGQAMADQVCTTPGLTFASVHDGNAAFSKTIAEAFAAQCISHGGVEVGSEGVTGANNTELRSNFESALGNFSANNNNNAPDFLYISQSNATNAGHMVQWTRVFPGYGNTQIGQTNTGLTTDMWVAANDDGNANAQGVLLTTYNFDYDVNYHNDSDQPNTGLEHFYRDYDTLFGLLVPNRLPPTVTDFSPFGPDAYNIVLDAIKKVALLEKGSLLIPREALRKALIEDTTNVKGLTGLLNCNSGIVPAGECNPFIQALIAEVDCVSADDCSFVTAN